MLRKSVLLRVSLVIVTVLAACESDSARDVQQGDELLVVTFDTPSDWETGDFPAEQPTSRLAVINGRYQIDHQSDRSASFTWGLGGESYQDLVIDIEAEPLSGDKDNLYGVGCRLTTGEDGDLTGYALLISGDGHYGIARIANRSLDFILKWHQTSDIEQGQARNTIRAVCIENYLAVYANGEFLGDVTDETYAAAGQVGLLAGVNENGAVSVAFDNLTVYEGVLGKK